MPGKWKTQPAEQAVGGKTPRSRIAKVAAASSEGTRDRRSFLTDERNVQGSGSSPGWGRPRGRVDR